MCGVWWLDVHSSSLHPPIAKCRKPQTLCTLSAQSQSPRYNQLGCMACVVCGGWMSTAQVCIHQLLNVVNHKLSARSVHSHNLPGTTSLAAWHVWCVVVGCPQLKFASTNC